MSHLTRLLNSDKFIWHFYNFSHNHYIPDTSLQSWQENFGSDRGKILFNAAAVPCDVKVALPIIESKHGYTTFLLLDVGVNFEY